MRNQRTKVLLLLIVLVASTTFSAAEPGGNGDGMRDMQCGGACHGDAGQNATSLLTLSIEYPEHVWVGQPAEVRIVVEGVDVAHDEQLIGLFLLSSTNANGDTPLEDGWEILSNGQGGSGNYVERSTDGTGSILEHTWVLRPDAIGAKTLYAAVHHADAIGPSQGRPFFGASQGFEVNVESVPEDLARIHEDFTPRTVREVGEDLTVLLHTKYTDAAQVEWRTEDGAVVQITANSTESNYWQFTLPAAIAPSTIEWRATLSGEGPSQTTPWFAVSAQITPEEVDALPIYLQGLAMGLVLFGAVLALQRPTGQTDDLLKIYDETPTIEALQPTEDAGESQPSIAPLPEGGLPPGWTDEQWQWYGHEYLAGTYGDGPQ